MARLSSALPARWNGRRLPTPVAASNGLGGMGGTEGVGRVVGRAHSGPSITTILLRVRKQALHRQRDLDSATGVGDSGDTSDSIRQFTPRKNARHLYKENGVTCCHRVTGSHHRSWLSRPGFHSSAVKTAAIR